MLPPDQPKYLPPKKFSDTTPDHAVPPPSVAANYAEPASMGGEQPVALSSAPSLTTLLHAFRRAWKLAIPLALLAGVAAAAAAWMLVPPQYTASVVFRILSRPTSGMAEDEGAFVNVQRAQVALMKSYEVMSETIEKSRVAELYGVEISPGQLAKKLVTAFNEGPEIMQVTMQSDNPEAAAALLNALSEVYPSKVNLAEEARIRARIAQLRKKLQLEPAGSELGRAPTLAEQLRDKRFEAALAEKKAGLDDAATIQSKAAAAQAALAAAQSALSKLAVDRAGYETEALSKEERAKNPVAPVISDVEAEESLRTDQKYIDLTRQIAAVQSEIDRIRLTASDRLKPKLLREPREKLETLNRSLARMIDAAKKKLAAKAMALQQQMLLQEAANLRDKVEQAKRQEITLQAEIARHHKEVEEYRLGGPKAPPEVEALRDQVKQLEREMVRVGEELASLEGSLPLTPRVTKHADVFVPNEKEYSRPLKFALAGGVVAFGMVLVGLCLLETRGRRVYAADDVLQGLGMRVVGTLPKLPPAARTKSAQAQALGGLDSQYGMTEAIDAIRTVLLHAPRVDGARVVMITSAIGGEGKTTLASHLAASLARAWRKTLLIDGDLRNPMQHLQFDQMLEPGLCEALRGEVEIDDAIRPTLTSRLWIMPAGRLDAHALQSLAQESVHSMFERLKEHYDFIVLDTSPVLPVPDALLFGKQADVVLLSVMKDHSRLPAVYQAQQRLDNLGIRVLGGVVIGEKTEAYGHALTYPRSRS